MTPYEIIVSELAEADIEAIFQRLLLRSPESAVHFRNGVEGAVASLALMPERCAIAPDSGRLEHPMQQLIYRHGATAYRVLFSVFEGVDDASGVVRVLRIRHGAQQHLGLDMDRADDG
jgi:plasmid stabilization system protein ParE